MPMEAAKTYLNNRPGYACDGAGVSRKHEQSVMGRIQAVEMRSRAVVERI